jgi:hypothetical protein
VTKHQRKQNECQPFQYHPQKSLTKNKKKRFGQTKKKAFDQAHEKKANLVNIIALGSLPQLCIQPHKRPQKARFRSKRPRLRRNNTYRILNFCKNVWT